MVLSRAVQSLIVPSLIIPLSIAMAGVGGETNADGANAKKVREAVVAMDEAARSDDEKVRHAAIDKYWGTVDDLVTVFGEEAEILRAPQGESMIDRQKARSGAAVEGRKNNPPVSSVDVYDARSDSPYVRHYRSVLDQLPDELKVYVARVHMGPESAYTSDAYVSIDGNVKYLANLNRVPMYIDRMKNGPRRSRGAPK